jgi:DNA-directed RNA polymerase sigma subunit (sigma70/sigma32)
LMAAGMDAIMVVLPKIDLSRNNKLSTVLVPWVHQRMRRAIENTGRNIRLPAHMQQTITHVQYVQTAYISTHGVAPDVDTLSKLADVPVAKVEKCLEAITMEPTSLVNTDSVHYGHTLIAPDEAVPHLAISDDLRNNTIGAAIDLLPPQSRDIIVALHGLYGVDPVTMTQLAVHHNCSREKMRNLISGAYQIIIDAGYTVEDF